MNRKHLLWLVPVMVLAGGLVAYWKLTAHPPTQDAAVSPAVPVTESPKGESDEEQTRRKLLGIWQDDYQGKRTMTLDEDGTGAMVVELGGLQATLFAPRLRFDMKWSVAGKKLVKKTIKGEPADKVNLILNTMGNTAEDTILDLTGDRLLLLDRDGKTRYDWRRVKPDGSGKR